MSEISVEPLLFHWCSQKFFLFARNFSREVQEMKQNMEKKILLLSCQVNNVSANDNSALLSTPPVLKNTAPECPVALRPLPNC